ncbi:MAG: DSBA oxidoreductase [Parcubacteria group bacterium LiPW_15]|nr:MAG: DSBA oxidoreductase [Parcubacteria group bacterium LiPW_15]
MDKTKRDWLLPVSILIAAVMISGSIIYLVKSGGVNGQLAGGNIPQDQGAGGVLAADVMKLSDRDVLMGEPNAPVMVVEYADFQCPFCGRLFTDTVSQIRDQYIKTGKVKMVYRDFAFLGPESTAAAEAAECAKDQGKFWAYHDALYIAENADGKEGNGNLNKTLFMKLAKDVGLDTAKFGSCIDSNKYASVVSKVVSDAQALGVNSTPTTFVNGKMVVTATGGSAGANTALILQAIDKALAN